MTFTWFKIFNRAEFIALDLVSKVYILDLDGIGEKEIMVTKGNTYGILYEGVFLSLELQDQNPFAFDGHAIYVDANNDVFLGIEVDES